MSQDKIRCHRCLKHPEYIAYHDNEWGIPLHDESKHFEMLILETMQAGLSWWTILSRRDNYRQAFDDFDPVVVSGYSEDKVQELMQNAGIIRNQLKIRSAITNAKYFLEIQKEFGSFDKYIWSWTDGQVVDNCLVSKDQFVSTSELSDKISKDLKKRWFKFVWSTIVYAHLQAIGIINDHLVDCFCYEKCKNYSVW